MKNYTLKGILCLALLLGLTGVGFAADTMNVDILANIPPQNGLTVTVSRVVGTTFTVDTSINFGTLVYDPTNNIFGTLGGAYYAVDVGVNSNAADWTVTHTRTSVANALSASDTLDNHINVTFVKQTDDANGTELSKVSFANSNSLAFTKGQLSGGWLRIYYGLATGQASTDAPGVTPIPSTQAYGNYQGRITLTLTQ
jgi:hypothetical protein